MSDATAREQIDTETGLESSGLRVSASAPRQALTTPARRKLTRLLLLKSIAESLFVFTLAGSFFYYAFSSRVRGSIDEVRSNKVTGWAVDEAEPASSVEAYLYIDGRFTSSRLADEPRPELVNGKSAPDERHGFVFQLPKLSGEHEASVYALRAGMGDARRTLHVVGQPVRFRAQSPVTMTGGGVELSRDETEER